jgi:hypothetical protein
MSIGVLPGGIGSNTPGPGGGCTHWTTLSKPSSLLSAMYAPATARPRRIPFVFAAPSGIPSRNEA